MIPDDPTRSSDDPTRTSGLGPLRADQAMGAGRFAPGTVLAGRYRVVGLLGQGGMGEVYRADDLRLRQTIALKLLPTALANDPGRLARFHNEVRLARSVTHPNVCRVHDMDEAEGLTFLTMEYVDGEDLASLLRRVGRLPVERAVQVAREICAGLAAAHDSGVLHRDLKPANVMIDGRGRVRISDFGLAVLAADGPAPGEIVGTPAYMSPEQVQGAELSVRSDLYALGLVLYEMFTGRAAFSADSTSRILEMQRTSLPAPPSSHVPDLDSRIERAILQCLEKTPALRPASARGVAAALSGDDALAAAIAAGETPSPEMVVGARKVGDLRPAVAWACLLAALGALLSITILGGRAMRFRGTPLPKPPEVLADRARDVLTRLGYPDVGADSAHAFLTDFAFVDYVARQDPSSARWEELRSARPGPLLFFYRESPEPLVSARWFPKSPWEGPAELGTVWVNDPPLDVPGMTRVVLDPWGRLTSFAAVPPLLDAESGSAAIPDWSAPLAEAGFDPVLLQPAESHWAAPVDSDRKAAWDGPLPGQAGVLFHIEAAAYRGRLVAFEMRGPWAQAPRAVAVDSKAGMAETGMILFCGLLLPLAGVFARRNLRRGRGDRQGAERLAIFTFASLVLANLVVAAHTTSPVFEYSLLLQIASQGLAGALFLWIFYMALEPTVRRRWPETLISWNRLLVGRLSDPLLGRDVLIGTLAGMALVLALPLDMAGLFLGRAPAMTESLGAPLSPRQLAYVLFLSPWAGAFFSVGFLFMLCLFQDLVRRAWPARLLLFLFIASVSTLAHAGDPMAAAVKGAILAAIITFVLVRFGLLASATLLFTFTVLKDAPLTLDWSAWYAGRSSAILSLFFALCTAAFFTSLGGKPLFGKALLED